MITLFTTLALAAPLNDPANPVQVDLTAELGFLAPVAHRVQFGMEGTRFDYVADGGQDNLFAFVRPTLGIEWKRQRFVLLYQPLDLRTTVSLADPLQVNRTVFPAGRPIDLRYGFSFWRASWSHDLSPRDDLRIGVGLGLQIRNATITFEATDGSAFEANRDIGPVPLLELEIAKQWDDGFFFESEIDGFYAPIRYLNGGDVDVEGAIADIQVRGGFALSDPVDAFAGVRYIGGGGSGTGDPDGNSDGFVDNWLHFVTVTVGMRFH
jgi:hypothetical protein